LGDRLFLAKVITVRLDSRFVYGNFHSFRLQLNPM
jgi:hypothetical protein